MVKQTAVEWLEEKFNNYDMSTGKAYFRKLLNEAKQMEKEQITNAVLYGNRQEFYDGTEFIGEQYYNETFGGQGTDDTTSPNK